MTKPPSVPAPEPQPASVREVHAPAAAFGTGNGGHAPSGAVSRDQRRAIYQAAYRERLAEVRGLAVSEAMARFMAGEYAARRLRSRLEPPGASA